MRIRAASFGSTANMLVSVALSLAAYCESFAIVLRVPSEHPTIQAAIDDANDGDTVLVAPGTYTGDGNRDIDFKGKAITVKSKQGPETCIIDCQGLRDEHHRGFIFRCGEDISSVVQGFTITGGLAGSHEQGGGILCESSSPQIVDCVIVGNNAGYGGGISLQNSGACMRDCLISGNVAPYGGGIRCDGSSGSTVVAIFERCIISGNHAVFYPMFGGGGGGIQLGAGGRMINCVITGNRAGHRGGGVWAHMSNQSCDMRNCVIWANESGDGDGHQISTYSCNGLLRVDHTIIQDGNDHITDPDRRVRGEWQSVDPCFARHGYWDDEAFPSAWRENNWMDGDYHLKSQAGRWDPVSKDWVKDNVTSPCIDAGNPNSPVGEEPFPNGGRINMGAYGGTAEASKSYFAEPVCDTIIAGDINGDCKVDFKDLAILTRHWLTDVGKSTAQTSISGQ